MNADLDKIQNPLDGRMGDDRAEYGDGQFESGFFGAGRSAWHGLGTVIPEDVVTAERALELAGLDWEVVPQPLYVPATVAIGSALVNEKRRVDSHVANVRSTDGSVLGIVSKSYKVVQNHEAFQFVDDLVDSSDAKYHTAGSLSNGKRVWLLAKLDKEVKIAGWEDETIEPFLLFSNAHDGSGAVSIAATPIRVVCKNTLTLALQGASQKWSARHTSNVKGRLHEARHTLGLAFNYYAKLEETASKLIVARIDTRTLDRMLTKLVPEPAEHLKTDRRENNVAAVREAIKAVYANSDNLGNIRGTKWGALQAVVEYVDHVKPVRGEKNVDERKFIRSTEDIGGLKNRALALLS